MDEPTRRAWSTPELIVLVRSGPEEAVLAVCKYFFEPAGPTSSYETNCLIVTLDPSGRCTWCDSPASS